MLHRVDDRRQCQVHLRTLECTTTSVPISPRRPLTACAFLGLGSARCFVRGARIVASSSYPSINVQNAKTKTTNEPRCSTRRKPIRIPTGNTSPHTVWYQDSAPSLPLLCNIDQSDLMRRIDERRQEDRVRNVEDGGCPSPLENTHCGGVGLLFP